MLIRLLARDIPTYWEMIKFACREADGIPDAQLAAYLEELLIALLSSKAQCWLRLNEMREIMLCGVSRIMYDPQFDEKYFLMQTIYSWERASQQRWTDDLAKLKEFALSEGCKSIRFNSRNPRIWQLSMGSGFVEVSRTFIYSI